MSSYLNSLHTERMNAFEQAREVADRAHRERRADLTADETATYERATARVSELDAQIRDYQETAAVEADLERARANVAHLISPPHSNYNGNATRGDGLEKFLRGQTPESTFEMGFESYRVSSRDGVPRVESRDIYAYVTQGSLVTPTYTDARLYSVLTDVGAIWRLGPEVVQTTDGNPRVWPKVTAYGTAVITPEGTAIAEADPTLSTVSTAPFAYKWSMQLSSEIVQDSAVDIVGFVAQAAAQSLAKKYSPDFAIGSGSGAPQGYVTGGSVTVTGAGTCSAENAIALQMSTNQYYRQNGKFATNAGVLSYWRRLRADGGGTIGPWLMAPPTAPGAPETIFGSPVIEDSGITAAGSGVKSVVFGDFQNAYLLHQGGPLRFERSDQFAFDKDLITFRGIWRLDGKVRDSNGLSVYQASS